MWITRNKLEFAVDAVLCCSMVVRSTVYGTVWLLSILYDNWWVLVDLVLFSELWGLGSLVRGFLRYGTRFSE